VKSAAALARRALCVTALAILAPIAPTRTRSLLHAQSDRTPDLEAWRLGAEVLGGIYAGYAGYFLGRFVGEHISDVVARDNDRTRTALRYTFGYAAGIAATAGAVYGIGSIDHQTGDFDRTLLGTGAGFVTAVIINRVVWHPTRQSASSGERAVRRVADFIEVLLPTVGATIAFNQSRRFAR
jgi:hypothetical protein